ncbi:hypothetical protein BDDG_11939, partial [Blastomyces dermatitidis ATCC 18188]
NTDLGLRLVLGQQRLADPGAGGILVSSFTRAKDPGERIKQSPAGRPEQTRQANKLSLRYLFTLRLLGWRFLFFCCCSKFRRERERDQNHPLQPQINKHPKYLTSWQRSPVYFSLRIVTDYLNTSRITTLHSTHCRTRYGNNTNNGTPERYGRHGMDALVTR